MNRSASFLIGLALQGCDFAPGTGGLDAGDATASATALPPESVCAARSGSYLATYQERTGTCGPLADEVVSFDVERPTKPAAPCTAGEYHYSADNCEVTTDNVTCPSLSGQGSTVWNGMYTWNKKSTEANGILSLDQVDDAFNCQSTYNVVLERL